MGRHFIADIVEADLASGKHTSIQTRFPPEPNGYLHLGHAKSICLNFGLAAEHGGLTNLRFDDTNPTTEEDEYVRAIREDVRWLGFDWGEREFYASDYFEQLYDWAEQLIVAGKAFVDDSSAEEISAHRGVWTAPGQESPFRNRSVEENLDLFRRMRAGEFPDGARVLRAKIDMTSGNINLRDPVMYRILHASHHRTGDTWCIYPMYDWAHGQSDSLERITHSICTLEFEDHRPLYDWFIEALGIYAPRQIEFARLNVTHTVLSKRKLLRLVQEKVVSGWDDPRMPTLAGIRRRGIPPAALRDFCERIGVTKQESVVDYPLLEHCVREELNKTRRAPHGGARPGEDHAHRLPGRQGRRARGGEQSGGSGGRHPDGAVLARDLDRPRRLPGGSAEEVLPPRPGPRGAPALGLHHPLRRGGEGRVGRGSSS